MSATVAANKLGNDYIDILDEIYSLCPKAVFAAIAVSLATVGGDHLDEGKAAIINEWQTLHQNGIVAQAVPARLLKQLPDLEAAYEDYIQNQAEAIIDDNLDDEHHIAGVYRP